MGVQNFAKQSGILGQQQKLRKAGRLAVLGLGALVLLPVGQASAGQCINGLNYAPGTSTRQPGWDFLCAGGDLLTWDFQRILLDSANDMPKKTETIEEYYNILIAKKVSLEENLIKANNYLKGLNDDKNRILEEIFQLKEAYELSKESGEIFGNDEHSKILAQKALDDIKVLKEEYDIVYVNIVDAEQSIADIKAELISLKIEIAEIEEAENNRNLQQSIAGLPPDASLADRMQRLSWWTNGGVTHNDQWSGPTRSRNTTFSGMIGADMPVSDVSTIGFGVGYSRSAVTQDTAFGGTTDTDTLNLLLKLDWEATGNVSFDMSAAYGISSSHRAAAAGYTDDYLVSNVGLGLGVSSFLDLEDDWRVSGRLGWASSLNTRYASTDSTGVAQGENTNATSQVQLSTKIEKGLPGIDGSVFADAKLNAVLVDESLINATASPFTLEFGAGFESQVSDAVSFNARGFVGSIGRANQTTFGGTLGLKASF